MTFLALSPGQVAALAASSAAIVLFLFFLKLRRPPVLVSSVLLWDRLLQRSTPSSWRERLRRLLSLFLTLGIAVTLAVALGRPASSSAAGGVAVLIDTSPTMAARTREGSTRLDRAKTEARRILAAHSASPRFFVGDTSGAPPVQALTLADALAAVDAVIEGPYASLPAVGDEVTTFVVTDGVAPPAQARATTIDVFEPVPNVTLEAFDLLPDEPGGSAQATFTVANHGAGAMTVSLDVTGAQQTARTPPLELAPGARQQGRVDLSTFLSTFDEGPITASAAAEGDGFTADNTAVEMMPRRRRILVALVSVARGPVRTALTVDPRVELIALPANVSDAAALRGADVVVYDGVWPSAPPPVPALVLAAGAPGALGATIAGRLHLGAVLDAPTIVPPTARHPILRGVTWTDVSVHRGATIEIESGGEGAVLMATTGGGSLLSALDRPRLVVAGFGVNDTDLPAQPSFPIFVRNAVRWLAGDATTVRAAIGPVVIPSGAARVQAADGTPVATHERLGTTVFDAPRPGVYFADLPGERQAIVVNRPPEHADPNASVPKVATRPPGTPAGASTEWWPVLLLAALFLAALEWWTYHRRITV